MTSQRQPAADVAPARTHRPNVLISGGGGTGKRTVGAYMALRYGYRYVNLASSPSRSRRGRTGAPADGAPARPGDEPVVATWPAPRLSDACRAFLRAPGTEWIWFDADRGASAAERVELTGADGAILRRRARFVDTFAEDGSSRPIEAVVAEILGTGSAASLPPAGDGAAGAPDARLGALMAALGPEDGARAYIEELRWPEGVRCPRCDADECGRIEARRKYYCRACKYQFRVSAGTIFHDSHLSLSNWLLAVQLIVDSECGFPANQLQALIGGSYKTAWFVGHRIRSATLASLLELGMPPLLAATPDRSVTLPEHAPLAERLIADAYHRPSPQHLAAYRSEAHWRAAHVGNDELFRETVRALLSARPLPWDELVASGRLSSPAARRSAASG